MSSWHGSNQSDVSSMSLENWPTVQNGMLYARKCIIYFSFYSAIILHKSKTESISDDWQGLYWTCSTAALNINYPSKEVPLDESTFLWWQPLISRQSVRLNVCNYGTKLQRLTEPSSMILIILDRTEQLGNQGANGHALNSWMQCVDVNLNVV